MRLLHNLLVACRQTCTTDSRHVSGWQWGCQSTILYFIKLQREREQNNRKLNVFCFFLEPLFSAPSAHMLWILFFFHSAAFPFIYFYSMWSNVIHSNKLLFTHHMVIYNSSAELLVPPLTQFEQNISDSERYHGRSRTMTDAKVDPQLLPPLLPSRPPSGAHFRHREEDGGGFWHQGLHRQPGSWPLPGHGPGERGRLRRSRAPTL